MSDPDAVQAFRKGAAETLAENSSEIIRIAAELPGDKRGGERLSETDFQDPERLLSQTMMIMTPLHRGCLCDPVSCRGGGTE